MGPQHVGRIPQISQLFTGRLPAVDNRLFATSCFHSYVAPKAHTSQSRYHEFVKGSYAIVMTKGAYVVSEDDALRVLEAVEQSQPHVLVCADLLGDGIAEHRVRIITSHVIAVVDSSNAHASPALRLV